jgi:hypothetical protein
MAMRNQNSLLKWFVTPVIIFILVAEIISHFNKGNDSGSRISTPIVRHSKQAIENTASNDSAAESLDTLTADLAKTKLRVKEIDAQDKVIKEQNNELIKQAQEVQGESTGNLAQQIEELKNEIANGNGKQNYSLNNANVTQSITQVPNIARRSNAKASFNLGQSSVSGAQEKNQKAKSIPVYTIPANATAVDDELMSALVGRIPVKGVVTDPYPFKIVFSNDTLAANGLRVPHLRQMVVSGYSEGDLNLLSVRGWVTSLTFVFQDGTISTLSSNKNNIGHFTKQNALGYLSDPQGNPFFRGKLISNAPAFLAGNVALGAAVGAANVYSQAQTTNQSSILGQVTSTVTGSPGKFVAGEAVMNAASSAQQWWHDREEQSFDAIYVAPGQKIVVNFAKEISIDYNPEGRKIVYANAIKNHVTCDLD